VTLTTADRARFADEGYLMLRGAIDPARVRAAREAIAAALAADESVGAMSQYLADTFCPKIVDHPAILALFEPLRATAAALLGTDPRPPPHAQIAIRFPQRSSTDPRHNYHLDGFPSGPNGVPSGAIHRHTLLAGAYLTALRGPDRGNFVVWPRSHRAIARFLSELDAAAFLAAHGAEALLARIRAHDLGIAPVQILAEPGDAILAHHLLAHGAADNLSMQLRETVYFRLIHPAHDPRDIAPLVDPTLFFVP
jgi:hypothetical protein